MNDLIDNYDCMMYPVLIFIHSIVRWLVLIVLAAGLFHSIRGYFRRLPFTRKDEAGRRRVSSVAHAQLVVGILMYTFSPVTDLSVRSGWAGRMSESFFYSFFHPFMMFLSIVFITIGTAVAKRKTADRDKFKVLLIWLSIALLMIMIAIPWPFSLFSQRPYIRLF